MPWNEYSPSLSSLIRSAIFGFASPGRLTPARSPFTSAMNTGNADRAEAFSDHLQGHGLSGSGRPCNQPVAIRHAGMEKDLLIALRDHDSVVKVRHGSILSVDEGGWGNIERGPDKSKRVGKEREPPIPPSRNPCRLSLEPHPGPPANISIPSQEIPPEKPRSLKRGGGQRAARRCCFLEWQW